MVDMKEGKKTFILKNPPSSADVVKFTCIKSQVAWGLIGT